MTNHETGTRDEWIAARTELLGREKELTRLSDELAEERRKLPWVRVEKEYVFDTPAGPLTLAELFDGRSQLIVYHFMHGPLTPDGCPGCSFHADSFSGAVVHLAAQDVTFLCASRSPLPTLEAYKERMGWTFPWVSSDDNGFNEDFAFLDAGGFNFGSPGGRTVDLAENELMALSAFVLEEGEVFHTYTTFDRGTDVLNPVWQLLDRAPKGRQDVDGFPRKHDEYSDAAG